MTQDREPAPDGDGRRLRDGVAQDRRIRIEDGEMRHGRKSSATRFDGYQRHVAHDIDERLNRAATGLPANPPETAGVEPRRIAVELQDRQTTALHIDRAYLGADLIRVYEAHGTPIVCKPGPAGNATGHFRKRDFQIDMTAGQATCPAGQVIPITAGTTAAFPEAACVACPLRSPGTGRTTGGRTLTIHPQEALLQRLQVLPTTPEGRAALRERVAVEHSLAHVSQRQGTPARFNGARKHTYHRRWVCAIQNLERAQALTEQAQAQRETAREVPERLAA